MKKAGADGCKNRGNTSHSKLTRERAADIREEWSRKQELKRVAGELRMQAAAMSAAARKMAAEAEGARAAAKQITYQSLATRFGVSKACVSNVLEGLSWPEV